MANKNSTERFGRERVQLDPVDAVTRRPVLSAKEPERGTEVAAEKVPPGETGRRSGNRM